ncbi:hypothetical protein [Rouxiella aceris]|uniref:hypothetical protein n=1 Tax=Rouxiella aceris TaxID=2703884 RepID=UPI00146A47DD|nr:hypothetical protein [Rouxiella aceris]
MVSWQYAPGSTPLSAEAVSGVLLGNRLTQNILPPLAFLHRPEAGQGTSLGSLAAEKAKDLWLSCVEAETDEYVALMKAIDGTGLDSVDRRSGFHNFNDFLGDPSNAALWVEFLIGGSAFSVPGMTLHYAQRSIQFTSI